MKILLRILGICLVLTCRAFPLAAQEAADTVAPNPVLIFLDNDVVIESYDIPDDIMENLGKNPGSLKKSSADTKKSGTPGGIKKLEGFRIQVFSDGRNPSTLQARAKARGNAIVARFPKYRGQVYSFSSSPNWYTRVGNFRTQKEASDALAELKRAFPSFAAEMRVVKSSISVIK